MNGQEMAYIQEAFDTNWIAPLGKNVNEFEKELAAYVGAGYGAALSAGTPALHLAVKLAGVGPDDIVLCSDLTFSATVNPVSYQSAKQVFVDSELETWNMDPEALEIAFEKYPQAKAVIVTHLYGTPAKIDEIQNICKKHHAVLIEDAAESLGATYQGRQTGTFGEYGVYSFNGNKIITTSGGGMLVSDCEEDIEKARYWATQARQPALHYEHTEIGYNYRMSNIVAGIRRGQLRTLDQYIEKKRRIYHTYKKAFAEIEQIKMNPFLPFSQPNFWLSCIVLDKSCTLEPAKIIEELGAEDIEARPLWKPMHLQPVFQSCDYITCGAPISSDLFARGLCLPSDIKMTADDLERVISVVQRCFNV